MKNQIGNKTIINAVTKYYMFAIKEYYLNNLFSDCRKQVLIAECDLHYKIEFYLEFYKGYDNNIGDISASYHPYTNPYKIILTFVTHKLFSEKSLYNLYPYIKGALVHEIEHHLQNIKFPFREDLNVHCHKTIDYINSISEIEAYSKELYSLHKQTKESFHKILTQEAYNITDNEEETNIFISNIVSFLTRRKDLNLFANIRF